MEKKEALVFLVPVAVSAVFTLLSLLQPFRVLDLKLYDLLLHIKPPVAEHPSILLLSVDDTAIARVGTWPWGRDRMAEGLLVLSEFGASHVVFDIEYTDRSPLGVNAEVLNEEIPSGLDEEFSSVSRNIRDLFAALRARTISLAEAEDFVDDLEQLTMESKNRLLGSIRAIARNNDEYLGRAAGLFGRAYFTVTMLPEEDPDVPEANKAVAVDAAALDRAQADPAYPHRAVDMRPAIPPILSRAAGAGFPNVFIDPDGVRRRIGLVIKYQDSIFPQLGLSALLDLFGDPAVEASPHAVTLRQARLPDGQVRDIEIPLDEKSRLIINWPRATFLESFRHMSFYELLYHRELEHKLVHNLRGMEEAGYLGYHQGENDLLAVYRHAEDLRARALGREDPALMPEYAAIRDLFFREAVAFLQGDAEARILTDVELALTAARLASGEAAARQVSELEDIREEVAAVFAETREIAEALISHRARLARELDGAFCIIGHIGTSTTDIGVTPFETEYMNVGTHAAVVNTIMQEAFLDEAPWWWAVLAGLVAALLVTLVSRSLPPLMSVLTGLAAVLLIMAGGGALFLTTGLYLPFLKPTLVVFVTFLALSIIKFMKTAQEKTFIRNAFSHYLSADVINEIISNPDTLKLGGEKKLLTAIFTDVKGFSSISEVLDPTDLVRLLNMYLTEMSDIILDLQGTIDKYEGDAIISFFGAPIALKDHARRACLASVRMKRAERELNDRFIKDGLAPNPLYTRIGVNTGEMVVGNMGTQRKMDYTIMGNSVNLAARLEGVNKQYGTWILASEASYEAAGDGLLARRLDRVRVMGISTPVRLYELVEEASRAEARQHEGVGLFHEALGLFENKEWARARQAFTEVLRVLPDDGPTSVYLKRAAEFEQKSPPESWDGVFSLTVK